MAVPFLPKSKRVQFLLVVGPDDDLRVAIQCLSAQP